MVNNMATTTTASSSSSAEEHSDDGASHQHVKDITTTTADAAGDRDGDVAVGIDGIGRQEQNTSICTTTTSSSSVALLPISASTAIATTTNKNLLLCRRLKDIRNSDGLLRNFNSLPLFVYATSSSTHAISADGVGVAKEAAAAAAAATLNKNDGFELAHGPSNQHYKGNSNGINCSGSSNNNSSNLRSGGLALVPMECLPMSGSVHPHALTAVTTSTTSGGVGVLPTAVVVGAAGGITYPHHLNLNHHHHHLLSHHSVYSNNYPLHHSSSHHHIHSEQTKSLQELQHEVGALLEFRDLVIETFPDLKHKMASMTSSTASTAAIGSSIVGVSGGVSGNGGGGGNNSVGNQSVSSANTLTGGGISSTSLASRREWEPGIHPKRKLLHKEPSTAAAAAGPTATGSGGSGAGVVAAELSSSSLTRSRSNSHSGKKEPKSGENNNGSVVQDSGFSTETSSSKEGHSASSTNGAMTVAIASKRLCCAESDDELLNLLDVIHRKSNRLREEVEQLQTYEREQLRSSNDVTVTATSGNDKTLEDSATAKSTAATGLTPKTFREHVERINREDIRQLRRERDRLLDKLAEMEAETLTGRIKAAKMSDQVEELISVKKDLEEQLKLAMAQKLELSSRVQQLQVQQQHQSKSSSSSQSDYSSQRNFLSSATTVLSTGSASSQLESGQLQRRLNTFQPVVIEQHQQQQQSVHAPEPSGSNDEHLAFHQSPSSDNKRQQQSGLGRLDGIVSTPGARNAKSRITDSKRFSAILLETNVLELQRHLLTLTVQNQVLMQKLESSTKMKTHLVKRLDKSKEDVEDLRFQLEEKNIELEGTKAQLRVLESRIHTSTPLANSYMHSQNDYETNRSSASTTLMLSRRGGNSSVLDAPFSVETRSSTPISNATQTIAPPTTTQISTPSMKAMVHLPMDEVQQHSSSTESAHEHDMTQDSSGGSANDSKLITSKTVTGRLMSTSVGGISPFEQTPRNHQHAFKKFTSAASSKPSKIPLPGSKAAAYFAGKPPTGRPTTAGRSPPSVNTSSTSYGSSRSSLSRSTGNLLSGKSPNSLKRADSAQSIRKDTSNNSLSTNTSRSSTSSSIPLATTPYSSSNAGNSIHKTVTTTATNPSQRVLHNSPLPKPKRESLTSRVRHLDSLSRAQQHLSNNISSNNSTSTSTSTTYSGQAHVTTTNSPNNSYLVGNTGGASKTSSIAAQFNSALRKDLHLSSSSFSTQPHNGTQQFLRRVNGGSVNTNATSVAVAAERTSAAQSIARRFSSASVAGGRLAQEHQNAAAAAAAAAVTHELNTTGSSNSSGSANGGHFASDSDSGKSLMSQAYKSNCYIDSDNSKNKHWQLWQTIPTSMSKRNQHVNHTNADSNIYMNEKHDIIAEQDESEETAYDSNYTDYTSPESMDCGSDNLLVTFDYGYSDSIDGQLNKSFSEYMPTSRVATAAVTSSSAVCDEHAESIWFTAAPQTNSLAAAADAEYAAAAFRVHHVQHELDSMLSYAGSSLIEYSVDDSADEQVDDHEEDNEEQFYDSLECA